MERRKFIMITIDHIQRFMEELQTEHQPERNFIVMAGKGFTDLIGEQIDKLNNIDYVKWLHEKNHIDDTQKMTILAMIESPDKENYEVAKVIIAETQKRIIEAKWW